MSETCQTPSTKTPHHKQKLSNLSHVMQSPIYYQLPLETDRERSLPFYFSTSFLFLFFFNFSTFLFTFPPLSGVSFSPYLQKILCDERKQNRVSHEPFSCRQSRWVCCFILWKGKDVERLIIFNVCPLAAGV